jgi:deferrochelatase/peroxidase EfeB
MDAAASAVNDEDLSASGVAAKVIGRTRDGVPLAPATPSLPSAGQPANAFGYFQTDPHGLFCPLGSHIRRANPRDGLARDAAGAPGMLEFSNNHRILRRGRKFGPDIADPRVDDGQERGLLFMCLNTDIVRQFEFVQQNWLLNQTFATLFDETDPLLGPQGPFTLPAQPLRRRAQVETFVRFAGGEYFFLPSLPALDYLQGLV